MAFNQEQREKKKAAEGPVKPKEDVFDPKADLSKMSLPEQLAWNKKKMAANQKIKDEKKALEKKEPPKPKVFDPKADISKMTLVE